MRRANRYDLEASEFCNRACRRPRVERWFALVSRLGDGPLWYALILALPLAYGAAALPVSLAMGLAALAGLACYKLLKVGTSRPRPYAVSPRIRLGTAPLDQFSFPSGHTLHAVAFSLMASSQYPELVWVLVPFTLLVAASRVVLGLHYPSDVLAGAALGALFGLLGLSLI
mgnify:CR=1 FL=1